jgi:hypothetical protein
MPNVPNEQVRKQMDKPPISPTIEENGWVLEHFPERWIPVFRKEMRQTWNLERFPITVPEISGAT